MATAAYLPPAEGWEQRAYDSLPGRHGVNRRCRDLPLVHASLRGKTSRKRWRRSASASWKWIPRGYAVCCRVIRDMDLRQDIGLITAPTLVIAGADDPATPVAMMEDIRERIADFELVVLPRAAHLLAIEQAERANRHLLGFLGSVTAA